MEVAIRACNWTFSWEIIVAKSKQNTGNKIKKRNFRNPPLILLSLVLLVLPF